MNCLFLGCHPEFQVIDESMVSTHMSENVTNSFLILRMTHRK